MDSSFWFETGLGQVLSSKLIPVEIPWQILQKSLKWQILAFMNKIGLKNMRN